MADELFKACVHESGHLFALRHFGGDGYINIYKKTIQTEREQDVIGVVTVTKRPIDNENIAIIGLAGHCAEILHLEPETDTNRLASKLEDFWEFEYNSISNTDKLVAKNVRFVDFKGCAELMIINYKEILKLAEMHLGWACDI